MTITTRTNRPLNLADPTYIREEIDKNPIWKLAFELSEYDNDTAPIGWGAYINIARLLLANYDLQPKKKT